MPVRGAKISGYYSFANGLDTTSTVGSPETEGTLSKAHNVDLVDDSIAVKRRGYTRVNSSSDWGTRRVRAGIEFTRSSGREIIVYGEDNTPTTTSGILGKLSGTAAPTTITTGLQDNIKPSLVQFRDLLFVFTRDNNVVYDGNSTREIGLDFPVSAPTVNTDIAGALAPTLSYLWAYTYYNSTTGAESSPSSYLQYTVTASGGVRINIIPGDAARADKIRIYRSVAGGSFLFLEGDTAISSTTFDSVLADSGLGAQLELDNSQLSENGRFAVSFDNRIFVAGFPSNPNRIQYSKIGQSGAMPESYQILDFADCNINDGDQIIGILPVNGVLIVLKERSVGKLVRIQIPLGDVETGGSQKYIYEEISREITGVSHHCMLAVNNTVVWLGKDDIYATDGTNLMRVGRRVRNTLKSINFNFAHRFSSVVKKDTQQLIFSVVDENSTEPTFQLVGHYRNYPQLAWTTYNPGETSSTHPGLPAASLFEITASDGKPNYYFGSAQANGRIYKMDSGYNDDGLGIYFDMRMPWDSYKIAAAKKLFHSFFVFALGDGNDYNIDFTFEAENEEVTLETASESLYVEGNSFWDNETWDNFNWASLRFVLTKFYPHRRVYLGRYGVQNFESDQPVAVKGINSVGIVDPILK